MLAVEKLLEVHAGDELHHHEVLPADLAEVVGLDDVGMDQVGHEAGLADEAARQARGIDRVINNINAVVEQPQSVVFGPVPGKPGPGEPGFNGGR